MGPITRKRKEATLPECCMAARSLHMFLHSYGSDSLFVTVGSPISNPREDYFFLMGDLDPQLIHYSFG